MRYFRFGLMTASVLLSSSSLALADYELNILHINDVHSRIEAINKFDSTCSAEEAGKNECFGGIARLKTAIDTRRAALTAANANVLVLDAGDQFQGSLFYTTYKSRIIAEFMNDIGFDAMAVGNHEFDDGPEEFEKFINLAKFPVLSGNTVVAEGSPLAGRILGSLVKEIGGQKVAIVSVLATDTGETSSPGKDITFADEITYLKGAVGRLEAEGANKIILLSHVGYARDQEIAAAVPGIDVIVGGHSHTLLSNTDEKAAGPYPTLVKNPDGVDVPIVQAYSYTKYLGDLKVVFDDAGKVLSASGAPLLLDSAITPDPDFTQRVAALGAPIEELKLKEVSETTGPIDGSREVCRAGECAMGNLVADAMLDRVKDQGVTIAIQNGGGLRASIDAGTVTMGEVLTVLPFQNSLATFKLTGADIRTALENGASQIEEGAGRFAQVAGLRYAFDKTKPPGSRITSVEVASGTGFTALDPAATYGVVTNNYMRSGGDGYAVFAERGQDAYDFGPNLESVVADYLSANRPYAPQTDGRITDLAVAAAAAPQSSGTATQPVEATRAVTAETVTPEDKPAQSAAVSTTPDSAATTPATRSHVVVSGDNLWNLAKTLLGDASKWPMIAETNSLRNPALIYPGDTLDIPQE